MTSIQHFLLSDCGLINTDISLYKNDHLSIIFVWGAAIQYNQAPLSDGVYSVKCTAGWPHHHANVTERACADAERGQPTTHGGHLVYQRCLAPHWLKQLCSRPVAVKNTVSLCTVWIYTYTYKVKHCVCDVSLKQKTSQRQWALGLASFLYFYSYRPMTFLTLMV